MKRAPRKSRPRVESLEDRRVMATWGLSWPDPQALTLSFVPDGTQVFGQSSQLSQTLNAELGVGQWETPILKAFQTWAASSNINIGVVSDGGQPVGTAGQAQGDPRFGDIRISAEPLPAGVLAITSPYDPSTGTLSGDMILNSSVDFKSTDPGAYDLFTVALHEAGHVFGFADSSSPSSFMYDTYAGPVTGLAAGAVPALQSLYGGARNLDAIDNDAVSTDPTHPVSLNLAWNSSGSPALSTTADLASSSTSDSFQFQMPSGLVAPAGVDVQVQTAGISLLTPKVTVTNASNQVIATASASGPLAGGASVHLAGLVAGQKYSITVSGATGDVFSVGTYQLRISATQSTSLTQGGGPKSVQALQEAGNYNGSTPLSAVDSITQSSDVDLYSFKSPLLSPNGVTIQLQDVGIGLVAPQVQVYNALGNLVGSATGTVGPSTTTTVFVPVVLPNATYYIQVSNGILDNRGEGIDSLTVAFNASSLSTSPPVLPMPWLGNNWSGQANSTLNTAANLQSSPGSAQNTSYAALGGIGPASSQGFFQLGSPSVPQGQTVYMTATVESLSGGLIPVLSVTDQKGDAIPSRVLASQAGVTVVQFAVVPGVNQYILDVAASRAGGASGNYSLGVTSSAIGSNLNSLASGTLAAVPAGSGSAAAQTTALQVGQSAVYQFVLSAGPANSGTNATIQATILDAFGHVIATVSTSPGQAASLDVLLPAGSYTILIAESSPSGTALQPETYSLIGDSLTDPIKPYINSAGTGGTNPG